MAQPPSMTFDVEAPILNATAASMNVAVDVASDGTAALVVTEKPKSIADRLEAELDGDPMGHEWVAQATVSIDFKTAKRAAFRGSFRVAAHDAGLRIDALEVMCHACRRTFDAVQALADEERARVAALNGALPADWHGPLAEPELNCPGKIDNSHLIGGDLSVRAKRIIHEPVGVIHYDVIDRRGMAGFSATKPR